MADEKDANNAARLTRLLKKFLTADLVDEAAKTVEDAVDRGDWRALTVLPESLAADLASDDEGVRSMAEAKRDRLTQAPYSFSTRPAGGRRLTVTHPSTGDAIGVTGNTVDDLLDALEARLA